LGTLYPALNSTTISFKRFFFDGWLYAISLLYQLNMSRYTINDQRAVLGDDIIPALECLKSWSREEVIHWNGSFK